MDHSMEDSGIDSDQRSQQNIGYLPVPSTSNANAYKALKKQPSELQKKIERQRDVARKTSSSAAIDQQPKRSHFVSRSRLTVPHPNRVTQKDLQGSFADQQPLVAIMSDDSEEDEFDVPRLPKAAQKEIKEQLIKDGYNLDLEPDDEDLDLIPPRPLNERCACCNLPSNCYIM